MAQDGARGILVVAVLGLCLALAHAVLGQGALTLVVGVAFVGTLADYLFPIAYELTPASAVVHDWMGRREVRWAILKGMAVGGRGMLLTTLPVRAGRDAGWLHRFRGTTVYFGDADRGAIIAYARARLGRTA